MPLQEHNYWLTTAEFPTPDPSRPLPEVVNVAVIGAGFTGLSAARTLAKRGANVAVLESETIGWGASSRNGGMVLTGMKLGENWRSLGKYFHQFDAIIGVILLSGVGWFVWSHWQNRVRSEVTG